MVKTLQFALVVDSVPPLKESILMLLLGQLLEEYVHVQVACASLDSLPIVHELSLEEQTLRPGIFAETDSKAQRGLTMANNTFPEAAEPGVAGVAGVARVARAGGAAGVGSAAGVPGTAGAAGAAAAPMPLRVELPPFASMRPCRTT